VIGYAIELGAGLMTVDNMMTDDVSVIPIARLPMDTKQWNGKMSACMLAAGKSAFEESVFPPVESAALYDAKQR